MTRLSPDSSTEMESLHSLWPRTGLALDDDPVSEMRGSIPDTIHVVGINGRI
jgi:hypothetical protein